MKAPIIKALEKALIEKGIKLGPKEIDKFLEIPPSQKIGDYAFPCFFLASKLKQDPARIALELRAAIGTPPKHILEIHTQGAYINFFLDRNLIAENLVKKIIKDKENYGKHDLGKGKKILIEHTSINPNASPHVGRARNAIIGDSIVRLHRFFGYKPEVHYYVNDVSKQIAMLVAVDAQNLKFEEMLKAYVKAAKKIKGEKFTLKVFEILYNFEKGDPSTVKKFIKIAQTCVKGQERILAELGITYDKFDYESDYLGKSAKIVKMLDATGKLFKDKDKRLVLNQEKTSVEGKMKSPVLVLTRSDGTGLYPLRDIAYTIDKLKIAKENIIVLGEDQKLYFQQLSEALKLLKIKAPNVVHYSFITLASKSSKGKNKKMSTRKGDVVLLEDFLNEATKKAKRELKKRASTGKKGGDPKAIAIGAVKYAIIKNNPNKGIIFSLDEALSFEGDTGPYILYSYARASSILRKAKVTKEKIKVSELHEKEVELVKKLSLFPITVANAFANSNPALIANYSYQLAQIFNEFYHACPVIQSDIGKQSFRLALVESFRIVLKSSLFLLGIEAVEKM